MIVNKKLDRFKQWAGERMGGEVKTNTTEQFKALEQEMELRQTGMEKMQEAMSGYVKAISKRSDIDRKEKTLPIAHMGSAMVAHGDDFEHDSEFGQCLVVFGRGQERLARAQESYVSAATNSWLESLDRSLVQMKEYQAARKKLESRRLAYDTSLAKMQKAKREDFRVEEELRSQQAKYEEAEADVERRMFEIKEAEGESITDLTSFLEAQLAYHDRCREALVQLQNDWPARSQPAQGRGGRSGIRSRSNTVKSYVSSHSQPEEPPTLERLTIRSGRPPSSRYLESPTTDYDESPRTRPGLGRSTTYQGPSQSRRDMSPIQSPQLTRVPSDSLMIQATRSGLRRVDTAPSGRERDHDVFGDDSTAYSESSPEYSFSHRSISPATSHGSSATTPLTGGRKGPPPPPPSRASKPGGGKAPPPPPPVKRTLIP